MFCIKNTPKIWVKRCALSKSLTHWQKSSGLTKLELPGVVTRIVDKSSYLRGNEFIVDCDHKALRPLFQNKFKGAIYDRWLAVLQQYKFEIIYTRCANAGRRCTLKMSK